MIQEMGDERTPHSLSFVLEVPSEESANALRRALAGALGQPVEAMEVTHHDDFTRHWAVKARLPERTLTERSIAALHRQLRESARVYDGLLAKFSLHKPGSRRSL
jgi:hypothetical protein